MTERKCFVFKFADIEVREREFLLIKAGERISVEPKAFRVLLFLLRNPGRLITKDEIVGNVWSDSVVSDNSLTRSIAQLRRVLGDDSREPLYILTVPTVGYRFLSEVSSTEDGFGLGSASSHLHASGTATEQPSDVRGVENPESLDQATSKGDLPLNLQKNPAEVRGSVTVRSRRLRLAGLVAAALLILFTGFLIRWVIARKSVPDTQAVTYRLLEQRVTSNPSEDPLRGAIISPDGKYVAYADPTGLYLRQMSTGETRPWSLPKGFVAWPNSWFPDSTHLLAVRIETRTEGPYIWKASLYKISILGGGPQKIVDDGVAGAVSPDGLHIAYLPGPKIASELWVMDSDGANARKVIAAGFLDKPGSHGSWLFPPVWSPDSKRLAYIEGHVVVGSDPRESGATLMTISADGGEPIGVLNDSRVGQALWWAQDGRILFAYHQDPESKKNDDGVYSIRIDDRTRNAVGAPQQLTHAEGGIRGLSATADGKRLVLWRTNELLEAFITRFDARTHLFSETRRLTLDESENFASAWTADSRAVLFVSNRNGTWKLFKQGIDETTPETLAEAPSIVLPRLSPDGSLVIYLTTPRPDDASSLPTLMSKPLAGGPPHLIVQEEGIVNYGCARAPSKRCIYSKLTGKNLTFVSFDPDGGKGQELSTIGTELRNWVISPDGLKLAIVLDEHRVRFLSLDTGVANDVTLKDWLLNSVDWSADGQRVFMPSVDSKGIPVILEVDQTGRARLALQGTAVGEFGAMIQSPDGKYGLLLAVTPAQTNAWMVDNF